MIGHSDISYKEIRNVLNANGGNVGSRHSDFFSEKADHLDGFAPVGIEDGMKPSGKEPG